MVSNANDKRSPLFVVREIALIAAALTAFAFVVMPGHVLHVIEMIGLLDPLPTDPDGYAYACFSHAILGAVVFAWVGFAWLVFHERDKSKAFALSACIWFALDSGVSAYTCLLYTSPSPRD